MRSIQWTAMAGALAVSTCLAASAAAVPNTIPYLGELTLPGGGGPFTGQVTITAALYDEASGGVPVWGPVDYADVDVVDGDFTLILGGDGAPPIADAAMASAALWLQLDINGSALDPRLAIYSAPYALVAGNAMMLGGVPAASYLQNGDVDITGSLSVNGVPVVDGSGAWVGTPPQDTIDGLDGGTIDGSTVVDGDLVVSGDLIVDGQTVGSGGLGGIPSDPRMYMHLMSPAGVTGGNATVLNYEIPFGEPPVVVCTPDETIDDNGPSWSRLRHVYDSRAVVRTSGVADGIHCISIEAGVHTVDGKMIQAGRFSNGTGANTVANGNAIFFPQPFSTPPIVIIETDETQNNSGGAQERVIGEVSTGGFQIWTDGNIDGLHWIAFEPGDYVHGRFSFRAGVIASAGCGNPCTQAWPGGSFGTTPFVVSTINEVDNNGPVYIRHTEITRDSYRFRTNSGNSEKTFFVAGEGYLY